jgi:hypothetical protein
MEKDTYIIGAWIAGVLSFIGIWVYAFLTWGILFGLTFGWIPGIIGGILVGILWPLVALIIILILGSNT